MKFTLAQYNIIRELVADEAEAVSYDYTNMTKRFNEQFPDNERAYKGSKEYEQAKADADEAFNRLTQLNRILDKFEEDF